AADTALVHLAQARIPRSARPCTRWGVGQARAERRAKPRALGRYRCRESLRARVAESIECGTTCRTQLAPSSRIPDPDRGARALRRAGGASVGQLVPRLRRALRRASSAR